MGVTVEFRAPSAVPDKGYCACVSDPHKNLGCCLSNALYICIAICCKFTSGAAYQLHSDKKTWPTQWRQSGSIGTLK